MARDTRAVERLCTIRTGGAQNLVCYVTARGPWFGWPSTGSKKVLAPVPWVPETRTINTRSLLFHPRSRHPASLVWCYGVRQSRPKIIVQECTPSFDLTIFRRILSDLYEVLSRQVCPTSLGAGCLCLRQRSVSYLRTAVRARREFDGPEFAEMFERLVVYSFTFKQPGYRPTAAFA